MSKFVISFVMVTVSMMAMARKKTSDYLDARRNGAEAQMKICVVDDEGRAVSNASIRVFMGMNFRPKGHWIEGLAGDDGIFLAQGRTCGDEIEINASKEGFYDSKLKFSFAEMGAEREVQNGKWFPYGATEVIRMRSIRKPISLRKLGFGMGKDVPCTNEWIGIDMAAGDFVKPYGKGVAADFEFLVEWDGRPPADSDYCAANIRFCGHLSGGYYAAKVKESS